MIWTANLARPARTLGALLFGSLLLTACATLDDGRAPAPIERSEPSVAGTPAPESTPFPAEPPPPPRTEEPAAPPAPAPATPTSTLMASVSEAVNEGDLERAAAILERALRISPRDAELWYELANVRYRQQRHGEADGLARRALSFAGNDAALRSRINELLSRIGSS